MGGVTSRWKTSSDTDVTSDEEVTDEEVTGEEVTGEEVIVEVDGMEAIDNALTCFAWVTLATNDSYSLGALVLAHSLRNVGTAHKLGILITPAVSQSMREQLTTVFDVVKVVDVLDSKDEAHLALMKRPELGVTFTKLHCWRLTEFDKCVFLDADTLVIKNCDELFEREELSAAPDVGWPDCFNTGVFVYKPSIETFGKLLQFSLENGSFDGGDQGLLNQFFADWASKDIAKHLPFVYNLTSVALYSYIPAYKQYSSQVRIVHFIGTGKPWLHQIDPQTRAVNPGPGSEHLAPLLQMWWDIFCEKVHPNLATDLACSEEIAVTEGKDRDGDESSAPEPGDNRDNRGDTGADPTAPTQPPTPYIDSDDSRQINLPYHPFDVKGSSGELLNITFLEIREMESPEPEPEPPQQELTQPQEEHKLEEPKIHEPEEQAHGDIPAPEKPPLEEPNDPPPEMPHDEEPVKDASPFNYNTFFPDERCVQNYLEQNVLTYKPLDEHKRRDPPPPPPLQCHPEEFKEQETILPRFLTIPEDDKRQSMNVYYPNESEFPSHPPPPLPPPPQHHQPSTHEIAEPIKSVSQEDLTEASPTEIPKWKSMSNLESETPEPRQTVKESSFWKSHPSLNVDPNRKFSMPKLKPILPKGAPIPEPESGNAKVTHYTEFNMSSDWREGLPCDRLGFVEKRILEHVHKTKDDVARSRAMSYLFPTVPERKTPSEDVDPRDYDLSSCQRQRGNQPLRNVTNTRSGNNCFLPVLKPLRPKKGDIEQKRRPRASGKMKRDKKPKLRTEQQKTSRKVDVKPVQASSVEDVLKRLIDYSKDYQKYFFTTEKPVAPMSHLKSAYVAESHESPRIQYSKEFEENAVEEKRRLGSGGDMSPFGRVRSHSFPGIERSTKMTTGSFVSGESVQSLTESDQGPLKSTNVVDKERMECLQEAPIVVINDQSVLHTKDVGTSPLGRAVVEEELQSSNTPKNLCSEKMMLRKDVQEKKTNNGLDIKEEQVTSQNAGSSGKEPEGPVVVEEVADHNSAPQRKIANGLGGTSKDSDIVQEIDLKEAHAALEDFAVPNEKQENSVVSEEVKVSNEVSADESGGTSRISDITQETMKMGRSDAKEMEGITEDVASSSKDPVECLVEELTEPSTLSQTEISGELGRISKTLDVVQETTKSDGLELKEPTPVSEATAAVVRDQLESVSTEELVVCNASFQMKTADESCIKHANPSQTSGVVDEGEANKVEDTTIEENQKAATVVLTGEGKMLKGLDQKEEVSSTVPEGECKASALNKEKKNSRTIPVVPEQTAGLNSCGMEKEEPRTAADADGRSSEERELIGLLSKKIASETEASGTDVKVDKNWRSSAVVDEQTARSDSHGTEKEIAEAEGNGSDPKGEVIIIAPQEDVRIENVEEDRKKDAVIAETDGLKRMTESITPVIASRNKRTTDRVLESCSVGQVMDLERTTEKGTQVSPERSGNAKNGRVEMSGSLKASTTTGSEGTGLNDCETELHRPSELGNNITDAVMGKRGQGTQTSPMRIPGSEKGEIEVKTSRERGQKANAQSPDERQTNPPTTPSKKVDARKPVIVDEVKARKVGELSRGKEEMAGPSMQNGREGPMLTANGEASERKTPGKTAGVKSREGKVSGRGGRRKWKGEIGSSNGEPEMNGSRSDGPKRKSTGGSGNVGKRGRDPGRSCQKGVDASATRRQNRFTADNSGIAGAIAKLSIQPGGLQGSENGGGAGQGSVRGVEGAHEDYVRRQNWEMGTMDYMGKDSFDNIWSKICETIDGKASKDLQTPSQAESSGDNARIPQTAPPETHAVEEPEEMTVKDGGGQVTPKRKASGPVAEITAKASEALEAFGKLFVSGPVVIKGTDSEEVPPVEGEAAEELDEEGKPKKGVINKILELVGVSGKDKTKSETSKSVFYDTPESVEDQTKAASRSVFYDVDDLLSGEAPPALDVAPAAGRKKSPSPSLTLRTTPGTEVVSPTPPATPATPVVKDETLLTVDETIKETPPVTDKKFDQPGSSDLRESVRAEVEGIIDEAKKTVEESLGQTNLNQAMEVFGKSFVSGPVAIKSEVSEEETKRPTKREAPKPPESPAPSPEASGPKGVGKVKREAPKPPTTPKKPESTSQEAKEESKVPIPLEDTIKPAEENVNKAMEAFGKSFVSGPVAIKSEVQESPTEGSGNTSPLVSEDSKAKESVKEVSKPSEVVTQPVEADVNKALEAFGKSFVSGPIVIKSDVSAETLAVDGSKADEGQKKDEKCKPVESPKQQTEENINKAMEVFGKSFVSGPVAVKSEIPAESTEGSKAQESDKKKVTSERLESVTQLGEENVNKAMEAFGKSFVSGPVAIKSEVPEAPIQTSTDAAPVPPDSKTSDKEGDPSKQVDTVAKPAEENLNKAMETFGKSFVSGPVVIKSEVPEEATQTPAGNMVPDVSKTEEQKQEGVSKRLEAIAQPMEENVNKAMEAFGKSFVSGPVMIKSEVQEAPTGDKGAVDNTKEKGLKKEEVVAKPLEAVTQPAEADINKAMEAFGKSFVSGPVAIKSEVPEEVTQTPAGNDAPDVSKTQKKQEGVSKILEATVQPVEENLNKAMEAFGKSFVSGPVAIKSEVPEDATLTPAANVIAAQEPQKIEETPKPLESVTQPVEENVNKAMEAFGKSFVSGPVAIKSEIPTEVEPAPAGSKEQGSDTKEGETKPLEAVKQVVEENLNKAMEAFGKAFVSGPVAIKSEVPEAISVAPEGSKLEESEKGDSAVPPALPPKEKLGKTPVSAQGVVSEQGKLEPSKSSEPPKSEEGTKEKVTPELPKTGSEVIKSSGPQKTPEKPKAGVPSESEKAEESPKGVLSNIPESLKEAAHVVSDLTKSQDSQDKSPGDAKQTPQASEPGSKASEALEAFGKTFISGPVVLKSDVVEPEPKLAGHSTPDETETDAVHRRLRPEAEEPIYCNIDEVEEIRVSTLEERERVKPNGSKLTEQILKAIPPPRRKPFSDVAAQDLARGILPPVEPSILLDRPLEGEQEAGEANTASAAPAGDPSCAPPVPPRRNRSKGRDAPQPPPKKKGGKK